MSFLVASDNCSGISDLFQIVYSSDTAVHMLSGRAYSRVLRGHFLVQSALELIMFQFISPLRLVEQLSVYNVEEKYLCYPNNYYVEPFRDQYNDEYIDENDITQLRSIVKEIEENRDITLTNEAILKLSRALTKYKDHLSKNSQTAQSWIQYIYYINIAKQFIRAGSAGNWQNHLTVVGQMINLFAATSHFQYAKSARLYLQLKDE